MQNSRPAPAARMRVVVYMSELNDASVSFLSFHFPCELKVSPELFVRAN